nr:THAP domain-containing protein 2-like [Lytechinus pictus]
MVNMKRASLNSSKSSVLRSDHFEDGCFDRTGQVTRLRQDAVPTMFDFLPRLQKNSPKPRNSPKERRFDSANNLPDTAKSSAPSFLEDHSYSISESPRGVKWKITAIMDCIKNLEKRLKTTHEKSRRVHYLLLSLDKHNLQNFTTNNYPNVHSDYLK